MTRHGGVGTARPPVKVGAARADFSQHGAAPEEATPKLEGRRNVEHLVRFLTPEGREAQHVAGALDDALRFVERLRNNEEASEVRVYRMQEIPIEFKTYYRVELRPAAGAPGDAPAEAPAVSASEPEAPRPPLVATVSALDHEPSEQAGRRLFSRS